ncbi:hypothetical protein L6164_016516 [Bauhinia variegata]|uniref:Uncharacterized protein n=1 Tax=Bauhinia variegata TaxID=167791 RepID=A0ACB9NNY5_BAUVA|nr:hypothetical protein L6164_016516 [Bauhinia variegata]
MFYINSSFTYCNHADENQQIEFSSPFHVDKQCYEKALGVIWDPPLEPSCSNSRDCLDWAHSTCNASATGIGKCICDTSYGWNDSTLSCTSQPTLTEVRQPPISRGNSTSRLPLILVVVLISIIILGRIIISLYVWKKKMAHKQDRESINRIQRRMFDSVRQVKDLMDLEGLEEKDNEGIGAWRLWAENRLLDLMDPSLQETVITNQFIRCAQLSLLCVQDEPGDRSTMSNVVTMLDSETPTLPNPKQPTFFMNRAFPSTGSSSKPEISLQTDSIYGEG